MKQQESNLVSLEMLIPGAVFTAGGKGFVVLEQQQGQTVVIENQVGNDMEFDSDSANWENSSLRKYLNLDVLTLYEELFGVENIVASETDLTTHDGLTDFGTCTDKIRIMTFDERRKYQLLYEHSGQWEWLLTAYTAPSRGYTRFVCCVSDFGDVDFNFCSSGSAVRPLCILKSNIFVSV